jgi:hypothetical protein
MQHVGPIRSSPKKSFAQYIRCAYSWWQIVLILMVSSSKMTYANVVSVPREKHNIYI